MLLRLNGDPTIEDFYIHITPRGRVLLLATWLKETPEPDVATGRLAIHSPCSQQRALAQGF
jgi:hypothetical protein